jgi:hypothetical protein
MPAVLIKCYVWDSGRNVVEDWMNDQKANPVARAEFLNVITALKDQPRTEWTRPDYGMLKRDGHRLGEVRFRARNVEHRAIGFFHGTDVFVLVAFATERDNKFDPKNILKTAQNRKTEARRNPRRSCECDF